MPQIVFSAISKPSFYGFKTIRVNYAKQVIPGHSRARYESKTAVSLINQGFSKTLFNTINQLVTSKVSLRLNGLKVRKAVYGLTTGIHVKADGLS